MEGRRPAALNGKILTGRDAAHKRITDMIAKGEKLPVDFTNKLIYYVGPVGPVRDEVVGPAGPTTSRRMDKFMETMLARAGLIGSIGRSERGAQGLGGLSCVLDVKVLDYPTHAVMKPVGIVPNCAATRHIEFTLDGSGPARFAPPSLDHWPKIVLDAASGGKRVDLSTLTKAETATWKAGDRLLLNGKILTGRDAAHKRITDMIAKGEKLPVDFTNKLIY